MYFITIDRDSLITLHTRPGQIGRQAAVQKTPEEIEAFRTMMTKKEGKVTFTSEGVEQMIIYRTSYLTG